MEWVKREGNVNEVGEGFGGRHGFLVGWDDRETVASKQAELGFEVGDEDIREDALG